ncbi:MAG: Rrf2 family transcriptional regulator, partial [Deltaproteobacteria bacterium]
MLSKAPHQINVGELVNVLEGGLDVVHCVGNPDACDKQLECPTRGVWEEVSKAMLDKLNSTTLSDMIAGD